MIVKLTQNSEALKQILKSNYSDSMSQKPSKNILWFVFKNFKYQKFDSVKRK